MAGLIIGPDCMRKIVIIFFSQLKLKFWVLKRTVLLRRSFEYPQHMFWLRNKNDNFQLHTLIWRPSLIELHLVENPEDRFSRVEAQLVFNNSAKR